MFTSPASGGGGERNNSVITEEVGDDDSPSRKASVVGQVKQPVGIPASPTQPHDNSSSTLTRQFTPSSVRRPTGANADVDNNHVDDSQGTMVLQRDATFRYHKAQIRILQDELASLLEMRTKVQAKHDAAADELERRRTDLAAFSEHVQQMQALLDKNKSLQDIQEAKQRMLETDAQVATTRKNEKLLLRTAKVTEVRLHEGTEALQGLKKELEDERSNQGGMAVPRHEHERLLNHHQRLEKQKVMISFDFFNSY
ncbi:hypothetical protein B5M09_011221 [Aphanomyces astaci]|uniref:Uncharacterized protein n=1 Tax=Aphanomyces astaci TaxID=112090 RepID=A0A425CXD8_APHAT|nr:hypothetical protein B5M09_011221 [Aphanomyces astaci]